MNTKPFWAWFEAHNEQLTMLSDLDEAQQRKMLQELQTQLDAYCPGLTYEMSEPTPSGRTLTFSAEGDTDLFEALVALTDEAPDLDWWEFVPFKQPRGKGLRVAFEQYRFNTRDMFFQQLELEEEPDILGLRIALPDPVEDDEDQLIGVYTTIEDMIGEFDCATLIGYFDTCAIPDNPRDAGFAPMDDLPEFIEWFKAQRDKE